MWVRLDDAILDNPKIAAVGVTGFALYVAGLVFCGRNLSNGFIPKERAPLLLPLDADDLHESRTVSALISHGLWSACDGGYMVHDYLKYNPSRARVLRDRAGARQRMTEVRANFKRTSPEVLGARTRTRTRTRSPVPGPAPSGVVQVDPPEKTQAAPPSEAIRREATTFFVPENLLSRWQALYPSLNVRREVQRAFEHDAAAPPSERRKKFQRYLVAWLAREGRWNGHRRPKSTERTLKERAAEIEANLRAGEDQHDQ